MATDLSAAIAAIPPVTRTLLASALGISVPVMARLSSGRWAMYSSKKIFQGFQVWRAYTGFFLGGDPRQPLKFLFEVIMLYQYIKPIEEEKYHRRLPDLVWQLICSGAALHALGALTGVYVGYPDMGSGWKALIPFIVHFYSKLYPNAMASLFGFIQTSIVYLPYAVAAMDLLMDGPYGGVVAVSGLIVSQALYMLEWDSASGESTPKRNSWLAAPTWFKNLFGKEIANPDAAADARRVYGQATAPEGRGFGDGGRGANTATTSGYNWGKGNRLGDS